MVTRSPRRRFATICYTKRRARRGGGYRKTTRQSTKTPSRRNQNCYSRIQSFRSGNSLRRDTVYSRRPVRRSPAATAAARRGAAARRAAAARRPRRRRR